MTLIQELIERRVASSQRHLSRILRRAENYVCEVRGFRAEDLVHLRLHLIERGGPSDMIEKVERMLLEPWR